jgi:hypothetical protein
MNRSTRSGFALELAIGEIVMILGSLNLAGDQVQMGDRR